MALAACIAVATSLGSVGGAAHQAAEADADIVRHFRAGQEALQAGQTEIAAEEFKKVLALRPGVVEARTNLGLAYYLLGEYEHTVTELSAVARQRPNMAVANLFLGLASLKLGQPDRAIAPLEQVLAQDPSNQEARRALARSYLASDNYRDAAREFRALSLQQTDKAEAWHQLGRDYLQISTRLVSRLAGAHRESAWVHRLAGDALAQRGFWNDALAEYRKAVEKAPEQVGLRASVGLCYLRQGKLDEAKSAFLAELQRNRGNDPALLGLAELSLVKGDAAEALGPVRELAGIFSDIHGRLQVLPSIELAPEQARAVSEAVSETHSEPARHFLLAMLYQAAGQYQKVEEHLRLFEKFSEKDGTGGTQHNDPGGGEELCRTHRHAACADWLRSKSRLDATDSLMLGKALLKLNQINEATVALSAALEGGKDNIEAAYWLVGAYQRLAEESFYRLEDSFPHSWRVHQMRGEAHKLRQAYNEAIEEFRQALRLRPNEPELYEAIGHAYLLKNSLEEARAELEKALELDPSRARSLFLLGHLHLKRREEEKAIPYLQRAVHREPSLLEARASLGTAYRRLGQAALAVRHLEKAASDDFYGDLHYQLYLAYRQLGKEDLARQALARSQELRQSSIAHHRARISGAVQVGSD